MYTDEEEGNTVTGDYVRTKNGSDEYDIEVIGTKTGGSYTQTVSGEETYTLVDAGNLATGHYDRTIQGDGTYSRTSTGAGAEMPSDTGAFDYFWEQAGDPQSGVFDLIQTGTHRYDLLEDFYDISKTQPDKSPGHMNWYPAGQTFVDPFWEYVGAGLEGMWDGTKMIANAGLNSVTFGNSPLNNHVNDLIRRNGGAYGFANGAANVGVGAAELASGAAAIRAARTAAAARRAVEIARLTTELNAWNRSIRAAAALPRIPANEALLREYTLQREVVQRAIDALR